MNDDAKRLAGQREEDRVYKAVSKLPGIKIWRNVYIPYGHGLTAEIDLLIVSSKAVIALEVKNYGQGQVVGSQRRFDWVLDKGKGAKPRRFYSPLKQSDRHLEVVSRYLGIPSRCCKGIVAFSDSTVLKKVPRTPSCTILNTRYLSSCLRRILANRNPRFSPTELRRIAQRLDAVTNASAAVQRRHTLYARHAERARKAEQERRAEQRRRRASRKNQ
ncbi:MAG: nuclease-related domain-containing protein [Eggerthellaceae bacterium]